MKRVSEGEYPKMYKKHVSDADASLGAVFVFVVPFLDGRAHRAARATCGWMRDICDYAASPSAARRRALLGALCSPAAPDVFFVGDLPNGWRARLARSYRNRRLHAVPPDVTSYTTLTSLDLSGNFLQELPESLAQLTALQKIVLSGNQFGAFPPVLARLPALRDLSYGVRTGDVFFPSLCALTALESLVLRSSGFPRRKPVVEFPPEFGNMTSLRLFYTVGISISVFADDFARLTSLRKLMFANAELQHFPRVLCAMPWIQELDLLTNQNLVVSAEIGHMHSLHTLAVYSLDQSAAYALRDLPLLQKLVCKNAPHAVYTLTQLRTLHIYSQPVSGIDNMRNLQKLVVSTSEWGPVREIPTLVGLPTLKMTLVGSGTPLDDFSRLTALRELRLCSFCSAPRTFPPFVANLQQLRTLALVRLGIPEIPPFVAALTNLRALDLSRNEIREIALPDASLAHLLQLDLHGNPLVTPEDARRVTSESCEIHLSRR